jgi:hypothetical protein
MAANATVSAFEDLKLTAWAHTLPMGGNATGWEFRRDAQGNMLRFGDYGNRRSPFGWEIEWIVPQSMGGSSNPENLRALHWKANAAKLDNLPAGLVAKVAAGVMQVR